MISYNFSRPGRLPTTQTLVRYHAEADRFYFRELDANGGLCRSGIVDPADLPIEVEDAARDAEWRKGSHNRYVYWKSGPASILDDQ